MRCPPRLISTLSPSNGEGVGEATRSVGAGWKSWEAVEAIFGLKWVESEICILQVDSYQIKRILFNRLASPEGFEPSFAP